MAPRWPKMAPRRPQEGAGRGQEGHPEGGPRWPQERPEKQGPKIDAVLVHFGVPVGPPAVIRGLLEALFFLSFFGTLLGAGRDPQIWISAHTLDFGPYILQKSKGRREQQITKKGPRIGIQNLKKRGSGRRFGETKTGAKNISQKCQKTNNGGGGGEKFSTPGGTPGDCKLKMENLAYDLTRSAPLSGAANCKTRPARHRRPPMNWALEAGTRLFKKRPDVAKMGQHM